MQIKSDLKFSGVDGAIWMGATSMLGAQKVREDVTWGSVLGGSSQVQICVLVWKWKHCNWEDWSLWLLLTLSQIIHFMFCLKCWC